jgi:hypothetical protein
MSGESCSQSSPSGPKPRDDNPPLLPRLTISFTTYLRVLM